ncbi:glycerophosphodiester phosphodiesterase family protein [Bizionia sediminis]|uniref:Glycerophosphodiester phosphodiesterase family protein n=1 Tax=Bizionia sediminis TaxID=1737064 RepID=A0ABW5KRJ3_9FLAO
MIRYLLIIGTFILCSCQHTTKQSRQQQAPKLVNSTLLETLKYQPHATPIISVHRGGVGLPNYPENCLETMQYVHDSIVAVFEIDIAKTKDNVLVLMHDNSLERTTTGTGKLANYNYQELQAFYLKDDFGQITNFKIPTFQAVLKWAVANQAILTVDIKRGVDVAQVIHAIRTLKAENNSVIITYDVAQSKKAHQLAPELLLSVSARNQQELDWLLESNIPTKNMLAFTGTRLSDTSLYRNIHTQGIKTMLGTLGNLDKQAASKGDSLYVTWHKMGIDMFATDRPFEAASALQIQKNN